MRVAMYPGTFDPITNGASRHYQARRQTRGSPDPRRGCQSGQGASVSLEERVELVQQETEALKEFAEIEVRPFENLLMHFAEECKADVIVRGLRAVSDFEYEFQMVAMNQKLNHQIETVFLMADPNHQAVSSRLVKEIARLGGKADLFVPEGVYGRLMEKYNLKGD